MPSRTTSMATMVVLCALLLTMLIVGFLATTAPFPKKLEASDAVDLLCQPTEYEKGDTIAREDMTVSVLNAGTKSGAAEKVLTSLVAAGFAKGKSGNGPEGLKVKRVKVLAESEGDPIAEMVARQFRVKPTVSKQAELASGVVVLIGNDAPPVKRQGKKSYTATGEGSYCKAIADPDVEPAA